MPSSKEVASGISLLFIISCVLNGLWIVAWHYQKLPLSLLVMLSLLAVLVLINLRITEQPNVILKAAFGIYLGWICVATIANVTALLVDTGWGGLGISDEVWAIVLIAAGTIIASFALMRLSNPFVGLSVVWAFAGIVIKRSGDYRSIVLAAVLGMLIVAVIVTLGFLGRRLTGPS